MPEMTDVRQLLAHELGDILYAEQTLTKTLPKLAEEATDQQLSDAFMHHLEETEQHVNNVEEAMRTLGESVKAEACPGIEGIKKEHDEFVSKHDLSSEIRDMFLTGAATRTEHYEIAAYQSTIALAEAVGEPDVVDLLNRNLEQEKLALKKVREIGRTMTQASRA